MSDDRETLDHSVIANPIRTYNSPRETNLCAAVIQYPPWIHSLWIVDSKYLEGALLNFVEYIQV